jgi:light-harvesting protein B-800-850 alpha chain
MINGRIWTIVSPNVGVPVFFVSILLVSLYIHLQVMLQTTWFADFLQGGAGG